MTVVAAGGELVYMLMLTAYLWHHQWTDCWEQARRLPPTGSRVVQIDGATHNVHRGTFNAFMQVVNDFLSQE